MTAFWLATRAEVRARWRALASLALLLGLVGGVVLGAVAGARRTDTAYPRLRTWAGASQLSVVPEGTGRNGYYAALSRLPQAAAVAPEVSYNAGLPPAPGHGYLPAQVLASPDGSFGTIVDRARLLTGRMFGQREPGAAVISQQLAAQEHLSPGGSGAAAGTGYVTVLAGRAPAGPDEIALGAKTMTAAHARIGQAIPVVINHTAVTGAPVTRTMRVVGEAVFPAFTRGAFNPTDLGTGAVLAASTLSEPQPASGCPAPVTCYNFLLLQYHPGTDVATVGAELTAMATRAGCPPGFCVVTSDQRPAEIRDYASVRDTPLILGALLVVLAVGTLAHVLLTGVRRRRRDLAVLKTLGLSRGQVLRVVAWQAGAFGCTALLVGLPLGVLAGRQAWAAFASAAGIAPSPEVPLALILLTIPATLLIAILIAVWPGWQAARLRAAVVLWTE